MIDYTIFYKSKPFRPTELAGIGSYDFFISAYNDSFRVKEVFRRINSNSKIWLVHKEYAFAKEKLPSEPAHISTTYSESECIIDFFEQQFFNKGITIADLANSKLCIDSTGFMRPQLMFLILYLVQEINVKKIEIIYSEPDDYTKKENTQFSKGPVEEVRHVHGFEGSRNVRDVSGDLILFGSGYDSELVSEVADFIWSANRKEQIIGFPSLQADMYQHSLIKSHVADEYFKQIKPHFAPANDPFVTATVISELVERWSKERPITNLYLSPLGTKAQTIGFVLFYIAECLEGKIDSGIMFPFKSSYSQETSQGLSKTWCYTLEFPII